MTAGLFREEQYFLCLVLLMCVSHSGMSFFLRRGTLHVGGCSFVSLSLSDSFSLSLGVLACRVERASADQPSFSASY